MLPAEFAGQFTVFCFIALFVVVLIPSEFPAYNLSIPCNFNHCVLAYRVIDVSFSGKELRGDCLEHTT